MSQEVEASPDSVVSQVCAADVKGAELLAEEQRLLTELEAMEDDEHVSIAEWYVQRTVTFYSSRIV